MFTTYIKNLNDMVFSTSESPQEQPGTGVLGRIGSWLSPWRGKSPTSPTENASPTGEQAPKLELEGESGETVSSQGKAQQREEEQREPNSNPDPPVLHRLVFASEGEDATQSAVVVSTTAEAGPRGEEPVESRKKRVGQDKEREQSSSSTSVSVNPGKKAGHVTELSPAYIQPQASSETQARGDRKLQVYLEETSLVQCGIDSCVGQDVVRTKIPKSLKVTGAVKPSLSSDSQEVSITKREQSKRTNARPTAGTGRALVGGSLKPHKDSQFEPQKEQTEADTMGRRNAARRKVRKQSVGDTGNSRLDNKSQSGENIPEGSPSDDPGSRPQDKTAKTGDSSASSSPQANPSSQTSLERGESGTSCPDTAKKHDNFHGTNSVSKDSALHTTDGSGDMEDEDSLYKVERKTETSESKRRSMKVSRSEVKLFTKNLHLNPIQSPAGDNQDIKPLLKKDEAKEKLQSENNTRRHDLKKINEDCKPVAGRIADKISMFERPAGRVDKKSFPTPRNADTSPARKAHERLKANFEVSGQRSRPVDPHLKARSSSTSPCRDRLVTIKEQAATLVAASEKRDATALPPHSAIAGMSAQPTTRVISGAIKSAGLDIQGKLDGKARMQTDRTSKTALKPDGLDAVPPGAKISIPTEQPRPKADKALDSKTADQSTENKAVFAAEVPGEAEEMISNISPQSKGPSRATSRSKRRKSKEYANPTTPNGENTVVSQDQDTVFVLKPKEEGEGSLSDGQSRKNIKVLLKQEEYSSVRKENSSRQELQPTVNKDEPDTASCSDGTKTCIDREAGENSVPVTQEEGEASKDSREPPTSSSSLRAIKQKQEPPVHSRPEKVPSEEKGKGEVNELTKNDAENTQEPHKDVKLISHAKKEVTDKSDTSNRANQNKRTRKETPEQPSHSLSDGGKSTSDEQESNAIVHVSKKPKESDERGTKSDRLEVTAKSSGHAKSMLPAQRDRETEMKHSCGAKLQGRTNEETVGGTEGDRKVVKVEKHVPTEISRTTTETAGKVAEKQAVSAHVEQMDNSPGDSCQHGANDAELPTEKPAAGATAASNKRTVEVNPVAPPLITTRADGASEGDSSVKEPALISASKYVSKEEDGHIDEKTTSAVKSAPSKGKLSEEEAIVPPGKAEGKNGHALAASPKGVGKMELQSADSNLKGNSTADKFSPVANGDISQQPQPLAVKAEVGPGKPRLIPNLPTSPGSAQPSPKKKLNFSWGMSQEDSDRQDAPSSWLDVDLPKQRLRVAAPKLNSSGSESNLLDTSGEFDDDDFIQKIMKLCAPFSLPPRKHNPLRPPQPPFALPAIKEDRFEKTFDPEEFKFGLRKPKYTLEAASSTLNKLHNMESKSGQKPFRASLSDRSLLLSSLDTQSRLKTPIKDEEDATEEKDEKVKVKSRLEGSCVLSSLTSSLMKGKKNGVQPQAEGTNSGEVSPSNAPQPRSPPLSQPPPPSPSADQQSPALSQREEVPALLNESGPPLPSFTDIKLPDYLEKYLPWEARKATQDVQEQEQLKNKVIGNMPAQTPAAETEAPVQTSPHAEPPSFPGEATLALPNLTDLKDPAAGRPRHTLTPSRRTAKGFHKRPGKIVLFERTQFSGQAYEIYRDLADATCLQLSALISVKVVRGCWVLYEKPDFQGRTIALEEGGIELNNVWAENSAETEPQNDSPMVIGSIRLAVWDYSIPCIDLFTEPEGRGRTTSYHDDTIETGTFGIPLSTASIQVHSGVWLVFSDPGFQGMLAVLENGEYPFPESWGFPSPFVGSLRPLKMGGFKVENGSEVKAVVYEKPGFQGSCMEIDSNIFSFCEGENADPKNPKSLGSLKIIGGLWVGYSKPGFEGQQHILEEGEYWDSSNWGGSEGLKSLHPVLSDFFSPHLKMFREGDFGGMDIDITVPVTNIEETGYGTKTQSLDVIGGVWVVFEEPGFCGESYVVERGLYGCPEDWGALQPRIASAMPVVLSDFETTAKFKVQLFSEPGFQGSGVVLEDSVASLQDGFCVASCKVLSGSWLAFEGADFTGRLYVLEEGSYPDLKSMGCVHGTSILSLQTVGFEFSLPSLTLFERCSLRGKRVVVTDGTVNLPLTGGCSRVQSVLVEGGIWVVHEGINYRGAQIVLRPGEVQDWYKFSSWLKIGSLRPLPQKQVHFRLRNRHSGLVMSLAGDLEDIKMMRIQEVEETGELEQIWLYQNGYLRSKLLEEFCLSPSGSMVMAGSRVGLAAELGGQAHLWSLTSEGFVRYTPTHNLVLDVKGGHHFDKNLVILNTVDPNGQQQLWDVEVL